VSVVVLFWGKPGRPAVPQIKRQFGWMSSPFDLGQTVCEDFAAERCPPCPLRGRTTLQSPGLLYGLSEKMAAYAARRTAAHGWADPVVSPSVGMHRRRPSHRVGLHRHHRHHRGVNNLAVRPQVFEYFTHGGRLVLCTKSVRDTVGGGVGAELSAADVIGLRFLGHESESFSEASSRMRDV
jgi:hypothetical protein